MAKQHKWVDDAHAPWQYRLKNWFKILLRAFKQIGKDNLSLISAGVAFYFLLAIFPLMAALVSLYGLFVDNETLRDHLAHIATMLPGDSQRILEEHLSNIVEKSSAALTTGALGSFAFAVWSASKGSQALMTACNITYNEPKKRGFFRGLIVRVILTLCAVLLVIVALLLITLLPLIFSYIGFSDKFESVVSGISWVALALLFNFSLAALYRYAPHRRSPKWRWVSIGSAVSTVLWLSASAAFSYYVTSFASYNETYGSVGGVVIMLMWMYLTAFVILLGAELNSVVEHHTTVDSTKGPEREKGKRGAYVADTLPGEK